MTRIIGSPACGNSPKNRLVEQLTIALEQGDLEAVLVSCSDDIAWIRRSDMHLHGKDAVTTYLTERADERLAELHIQHVVTHGKAGAVNGVARMPNGQARAFCYVYEFTSTKGTLVKEIITYCVPSE
jgi:hypothetical protein